MIIFCIIQEFHFAGFYYPSLECFFPPKVSTLDCLSAQDNANWHDQASENHENKMTQFKDPLPRRTKLANNQ